MLTVCTRNVPVKRYSLRSSLRGRFLENEQEVNQKKDKPIFGKLSTRSFQNHLFSIGYLPIVEKPIAPRAKRKTLYSCSIEVTSAPQAIPCTLGIMWRSTY